MCLLRGRLLPERVVFSSFRLFTVPLKVVPSKLGQLEKATTYGNKLLLFLLCITPRCSHACIVSLSFTLID